MEFEKAYIEIVKITANDIITTSGCLDDCADSVGGGWCD